MCPWQTSSPLTPPSSEWGAGTPWWWFNIISEHDWLWALETQHYTTPCRVLMTWKTRYHLFTCHLSLTESWQEKEDGRSEECFVWMFWCVCFMCVCVSAWNTHKKRVKGRKPTNILVFKWSMHSVLKDFLLPYVCSRAEFMLCSKPGCL